MKSHVFDVLVVCREDLYFFFFGKMLNIILDFKFETDITETLVDTRN